MDEVSISQLELEMSIGAYEWEKHVQQTIFVDLTLFCDTRSAGISDELNDAVDYAKVSELVLTISQERHYVLIESLAETIASRVIEAGFVQKVRVAITKPGAVSAARDVGVTIERSA